MKSHPLLPPIVLSQADAGKSPAILFPARMFLRRSLAVLVAAVLLSGSAFAQSHRVINVPAATGNFTVDTSNVQGALNAAQALFNGANSTFTRGGVAIVFPAGNYAIASRLTIDIQKIPADDGGLMIRGAGGNSTIMTSGDPRGALLVNVRTPGNSKAHCQVSIEDMGFSTSVTCTDTPNSLDSGAAIHIMPYSVSVGDSVAMLPEGEGIPGLLTYPTLRNVTISGPFKYGFKAYRITRSVVDNVSITGASGVTTAGLHFISTYGGNWSECNISNATYGVYSKYAGEGGGLAYSTVANVDYGMWVDMGEDVTALMSNSGSFVRNCTITAKTRGVYYNGKRFVCITHNTFSPGTSAASYKDVELKACGYFHVHSNVFSGNSSSRLTAISLLDGEGDKKGNGVSNMIHDNNFGTSASWVDIAPGVIETMIFNNATSGSVAHVTNNGIGTWISDGLSTPSAGINKFSYKLAWSEIPAPGSVNLFDVTSEGANGTDSLDDTGAINTAISKMLSYLNAGSARKAYLYFPAGTYIVNGTLTKISQPTSTTSWGGVNIYGDGPDVSLIKSTGSAGLFDIDTSFKHTGVKIHHLTLFCGGVAGAGPAVSVTGSLNITTSNPSLFMQSVDISGEGITSYFKTGVYGKTLQKLAMKDMAFLLCDRSVEDESIPDTCGVKMLDLNGCEITGVSFKKRMEKGLEIKCRSVAAPDVPGRVQIHRAGTVGPDYGLWIDGAGVAGVTVDEVHTNNVKTNVFIQNAKGVDCANFETLNYDRGHRDAVTGDLDAALSRDHSSVYLHSCQDVTIRDNTFMHSDVPGNRYRRIVQADGSSSDISISANHFVEPGETSVWLHSNTTGSNSVVNNRFSRTDIADVSAPGATTTSRLYQLNGENETYYLLRNTATDGGYLASDMSMSGPASQKINNNQLWKITAADPGGQNYTLVNQNGTTQLSAVVTKKASGYYTFVMNGTGLSSSINWQPMLFDKFVKSWDHSSAEPINNINGWNSVAFNQPFPYVPAVFVGGPSADTGDYANPLTVRVRNVTTTGFEFQLQDWGNPTNILPGNATVGFVAMHKGSYNIYPSQSFESGTIVAVGTAWKTCSFATPFPSGVIPCVFAQCFAQDSSPVCVRIRNVTSSQFEMRIEAKLDTDTHGAENVDYIAIEPSALKSNGEARNGFQVGFTGNNTITKESFTQVSYKLDNRDFSDRGFIGAVQTFSGNKPCSLRYKQIDRSRQTVQIRLDAPFDVTPLHPGETAAWMIFENLY